MNSNSKEAFSSREWTEIMIANLNREWVAFRKMLPELLRTSRDLFVAVSGGKVIDSDTNEFDLARRMSRSTRDGFVLIEKVEEKSDNEFRRIVDASK